MIELRNITLKAHGHTLLHETGLHVAEGEKVVLRGASGSGKSSLLKTVVGALPLASGSVRVDGLDLSAGTVAAVRSRVAFVAQEPVLGTDLVRDALLLPFTYKAHRHNRPADSTVVELLNRLHLESAILEKPCARISGGEKQRIAVARALLLGKTVFLADEVTSALDPESRGAVMQELFAPGITMLSVSHDPEWIAAGNRVVEIADLKLREGIADRTSGNQQSAITNSGTGGAS